MLQLELAPPSPVLELWTPQPMPQGGSRRTIAQAESMPAGADAVAIRVNRGGVGLDLADRMFVDLQKELAVARRVPRHDETVIENALP